MSSRQKTLLPLARCQARRYRDGTTPLPPSPMDVDTYELILASHSNGSISHMHPDDVSPRALERHESQRGGTFQRAGEQYLPAELKLREDFARNKMRWVGEFWSDLWYFSINTNPFLALCYSHPLHPISKTERYVITLFQVMYLLRRIYTSRNPSILGSLTCIDFL